MVSPDTISKLDHVWQKVAYLEVTAVERTSSKKPDIRAVFHSHSTAVPICRDDKIISIVVCVFVHLSVLYVSIFCDCPEVLYFAGVRAGIMAENRMSSRILPDREHTND